MDLRTVVDQYAAYDLWANTRLLDRLQREPETVVDAHVKSSFPSIRATLMHIRNAEAAWLARCSGAEQRWPAEPSDALDTFLPHISAIREHVRMLTNTDLLGEAVYQDLKGNTHRQPRWQMLMHCFNHGSYHRGQVVTMMRELDLGEIPALDLVVFQRLSLSA